jgi:hypothetical protein
MAKVNGTQWNFQEKNQRVSRVNSEFLRNSISQHMCQDGSVNLPTGEVDAIIRNLSRKEKKISKLWWALGFAAIFSVALFALTFASALTANEKSKESHVSDHNIQGLDGQTVGTNDAASYVPLSRMPEMPMSYIEKLDRVTFMHNGELRVDLVESAEFSEGRLALYVRGGAERITVKCGVVRLYSENGGLEVGDVVEDSARRLEAAAPARLLKAKAYTMAELESINARFNAGRALSGEQALYDLYEFFGGISTSTIAPDTVTGPALFDAAGEEEHCSGQRNVNRPSLTADEANEFFKDAAASWCALSSYDGDSVCTICDDITSGAVKFSDEITHNCINGNTATMSMSETVSKMWVGGATAALEEKCGSPLEIEETTCPFGSYAYFAFAVLQDAADNGNDGGLFSFGSIEEMCSAVEGAALPDENSLTSLVCEQYSFGGVDDDTEFEYRCEGGEMESATFGDMWTAGHQRIEHYFDEICGDDGLRHLTVAGTHVFGEDETESFARQLWWSPPPPPSGGSLGNCCDNSCFGRCGPGCTKWTWVCGTDNNHQGCQEHDDFCSCVGMWHPRCWGFLSHSCWWPGCAAGQCAARSGCYCGSGSNGRGKGFC